MINYGYLYCVYSYDGKKNEYFNEELIPSFKSLKKALPAANISLYTNIKFDNNKHGFNHVIYDPDIDKRLIAKAHGLLKSPYDRTIFLDADTLIHKDKINDIFEVLDEFNFAAVHDDCFGRGTPFPDFNTGLIGIKKNTKTQKLLKKWIKLFEESPEDSVFESFPEGHSRHERRVNEQWSFREVFMKNKAMFYVLPNYFVYRWHILKMWPRRAVVSHDRCMNKHEITMKIIDSFKKTLNYK